MKFENKYFRDFKFTDEQVKKYLDNAFRDLKIARKVDILEVKFNYAYSAFIKAGIVLISFYQVKTRSIPGHHVKIIEKVAQILEDDSVTDIGNLMRSKRNLDFYAGGVEVTKKECREYIEFVERLLSRVSHFILKNNK